MSVSLLQTTLGLVPSHREPSISRAALAERAQTACSLNEDAAGAAVTVTLELLRLMDLVQGSDDRIRLTAQTQTYCRNSVAWYLSNGREILSNWDRSGTASEEIAVANLLEQAPYFLKALEERRYALAITGGLPLAASREQPCSIVLVKIVKDHKIYFLHQWDLKAERYQLIGGKQRSNETPEQTANREFLEEAGAKMIPGKTLFISRSPIPTLVEYDISRTYGALTKYEMSIFQASLTGKDFRTSEANRWLSIDEMIAGVTAGGASIAKLPSSIASNHPGFLEALPASFEFHGRLPVVEAVSYSHESPEAPSHISLRWLAQLVSRLSLHDLMVLIGALTFLVSISFAAGKMFEQFMNDRERRASYSTSSSPGKPTPSSTQSPAKRPVLK